MRLRLGDWEQLVESVGDRACRTLLLSAVLFGTACRPQLNVSADECDDPVDPPIPEDILVDPLIQEALASTPAMNLNLEPSLLDQPALHYGTFTSDNLSGSVFATSVGADVGDSLPGFETTLSPCEDGALLIKVQEFSSDYINLGAGKAVVRGDNQSISVYSTFAWDSIPPAECSLVVSQVLIASLQAGSPDWQDVYVVTAYRFNAAGSCEGIVGDDGAAGSWGIAYYPVMTLRNLPGLEKSKRSGEDGSAPVIGASSIHAIGPHALEDSD